MVRLPFFRSGERRDDTAAPGNVALGNLAIGGRLREIALTDLEKEKLAELRRGLHRPFNIPYVTERLFKMAKAIDPHLADYDLVVREQISGELPGLLFDGLIKARREALGLPPSKTTGINGRFEGTMQSGFLPAPSSADARTLIVSEYANTGDSAKRVYRAVATQRDPGSIDVLVLDAHVDELPLADGSKFFRFHHGGIGESMEGYLTMNDYARSATGLTKSRDGLQAGPAPNVDNVRVTNAHADIAAMIETFYALLPMSSMISRSVS